jgi:hypothetical protein
MLEFNFFWDVKNDSRMMNSISVNYMKKNTHQPSNIQHHFEKKILTKDHWHLQCNEQQKNKLNLKRESKEKQNA